VALKRFEQRLDPGTNTLALLKREMTKPHFRASKNFSQPKPALFTRRVNTLREYLSDNRGNFPNN